VGVSNNVEKLVVSDCCTSSGRSGRVLGVVMDRTRIEQFSGYGEEYRTVPAKAWNAGNLQSTVGMIRRYLTEIVVLHAFVSQVLFSLSHRCCVR